MGGSLGVMASGRERIPEEQCSPLLVQCLASLQLLQLSLQLQASRLAQDTSPQDCQQHIGLLGL